jgi:hypothetical protein
MSNHPPAVNRPDAPAWRVVRRSDDALRTAMAEKRVERNDGRRSTGGV